MANWQKKAAKLAAGVGGGSAARIADLAQQAAGKPMSRREFLQKVGALAGSAALKKVPVPDAPAVPAGWGAVEAGGAFVVPPQHLLPPGMAGGFDLPGNVSLEGLRTRDGAKYDAGLFGNDIDTMAMGMSQEEVNRLAAIMEQARKAADHMPRGVRSQFNYLTGKWHAQVPTHIEYAADGSGSSRAIGYLRDNKLPYPMDDSGGLAAMLEDIAITGESEGTLFHPSAARWGGRSLTDSLRDGWRRHREDAVMGRSNPEWEGQSQVSRAQALEDLGRAAGGRANDPPPPTAMRRHPLGFESMGLPGDEERDAFGRVRRVLGVALPLGAAAGSQQQDQPRLLDGLRN